MMNVFYNDLTTVYNWSFHWLFCVIFIIGLALLVVWLARYLIKTKQLVLWGVVLTIVGFLGLIFTWSGFGYGMMGNFNQLNLQDMYQHMMDVEFDSNGTSEDFREHMLEEMADYLRR